MNVYVENNIPLPNHVDNHRVQFHFDKYNCRKDLFYLEVEYWVSQILTQHRYPSPVYDRQYSIE